MSVNSPNPEAGKRLRAVRERLGLTTREVERLSRAIADQRKNPEFNVSHAWLSEVERGDLTPGIFKIYSLAAIYKHRFDQVLAFFGLDLSDLAYEQVRQPLPLTRIVGTSGTRPEIVAATTSGVPWEQTDLVSRMFSGLRGLEAELFPDRQSESAIYGYVGTKDYTMFPVIRPGSFVQIDPAQRRIERAEWSNPFERPIYFVELRDEYACAWCEETQKSLLLVPYPRSGSRIREVPYPTQAGIIGRVTAVTMHIGEMREKSSTSSGRT
jgi:transcriptional regulator with XRE-family HTH domain